MPLLCFRFPVHRHKDDDCADILSSLDSLDLSIHRASAEEPPPLSPNETNLFDTFPRIVFGGYRRYYESNAGVKTPRCREKASVAGEKDPWSWHDLPQFTGKRRRRRTSSTPSSHNTHSTSSTEQSRPQLREKPRIRSSGGKPLVDLSYPWPDWLWPDAAGPKLGNAGVEREKKKTDETDEKSDQTQ
ncbi:hypothetical protein MIND_01184700 [Mycena indigotica]|uniref:Uncharacterized protein n=1 Tax=Mycena indigotica TaxID=2126181 RepID=A0A8H6S6S8_9AGAR|nr:uncharacterized protein MIND_01184700 [Mycena indigotica]KAF7292857.1 hypothetical protein MIND_01184700 [Mycena indigotica]